MTRLAILLGAVLLAGCQLTDFCQPEDGSEVTFFVDQGSDRSDPWTFSSIQGALDAADGRPTTVCVPRGLYREELRVPGGVHLLGEGTSAVRLRPPEANWIPHPGFVDRVLLTLEPAETETATVEGFDLGGAAICIDSVGDGVTTLEGLRIAGCAVGLRGSAGTLVVDGGAIRDHSSWAVHVDGMASLELTGVELSGNGEAVRPEEDRPVFVGAWTKASQLDAISGGGAVRAIGVDALALSELTVTGNWFRSALIDLDSTRATITDSELDVRAVVTTDGPRLSGSGPVLGGSGGAIDVRRLRVWSDGQPLFVGGEATTLALDSVAWDGRGDGAELEDGAGPAIELEAGGQLVLVHVTLVGDGTAPALDLGGDTVMAVVNSILWGHDEGIRVAADAELTGGGAGTSLFQDDDVEGEELLDADDPDLRDDLSPRSGSPVRCAGDPDLASPQDLDGDPRPYEAGKAPDLGAIERQEPCP